MALRDLIFAFSSSATLTVATVATLEAKKPKSSPTVAIVATVTVAKLKNDKSDDRVSIHQKGNAGGVFSSQNRADKASQITALATPVDWLREHRKELLAAGWTARELYRYNRSKGLLWMAVWNRPALEVKITEGGVLEFWFTENGSSVKQTARPKRAKTTEKKK